MTGELRVAKAHAYGNDFLLIDEREPLFDMCAGDHSSELYVGCAHVTPDAGADGVVLYGLDERRATMRLFNADGSPSELSGNGLRCLAALVARQRHLTDGSVTTVETYAGMKTLELLGIEGARYTFRTALGPPADVRQLSIPVFDEMVTASVLSVGNPQSSCWVHCRTTSRFNRLGPALSTHSLFPAGTNVEFAQVESPDRVRILIWERGVGPDELVRHRIGGCRGRCGGPWRRGA